MKTQNIIHWVIIEICLIKVYMVLIETLQITYKPTYGVGGAQGIGECESWCVCWYICEFHNKQIHPKVMANDFMVIKDI